MLYPSPLTLLSIQAMSESSPRAAIRAAACIEALQSLAADVVSPSADWNRVIKAVQTALCDANVQLAIPQRRHAKTIAAAACASVARHWKLEEVAQLAEARLTKATMESFRGSCKVFLKHVEEHVEEHVGAVAEQHAAIARRPREYMAVIASVAAHVSSIADQAVADAATGSKFDDDCVPIEVYVGKYASPRRAEPDEVADPSSICISVSGDRDGSPATDQLRERLVVRLDDALGDAADVRVYFTAFPGPPTGSRPNEEQAKWGTVLDPEPSLGHFRTDATFQVAYQAVLAGEAIKLVAKHSNVVATFLGPQATAGYWTGRAALVIVVRKKGIVPLGEDEFPRTFFGIPIDIEEGRASLAAGDDGCIDSYCWPGLNVIGKVHVLKGGSSIGNGAAVRNGGGTLGLVVRSTQDEGGNDDDGRLYGLTCSHVLPPLPAPQDVHAPSHKDWTFFSKYVGNAPRVSIGTVDLRFGPEHIVPTIASPGTTVDVSVDCARIALGLQDHHCAFDVAADGDKTVPQITGLARLQDVLTATDDIDVSKMGRTTGYTQGKIKFPALGDVHDYVKQNEGLVEIAYTQDDRQRHLRHQLFVHPNVRKPVFVQGGDSGAVVVGSDGLLVGLLCADLQITSRAMGYGVVTPIEPVFQVLGVRL